MIMHITGKTPVYGLIGDPVAHSLSPLLHNTLAGLMGHDMTYVSFPVAADSLPAAIAGAYALGIAGLNITAPYKSAVIPYLAALDPAAARVGVVNTLVAAADGYIGHNTDLIGLYLAMKRAGMEVKNADVVILGAGGAAKAAAFMCVERGARRVFILNRSSEKARLLADELSRTMPTGQISALAYDEIERLPEGGLLAIQCTSAGMHPHTDEAPISDPAFYARVKAGMDMIYQPAETLFMREIKKKGGRAENGLAMLLYQGIASYELWQGVEISEEYVERVYRNLAAAL